LRRSKSGGMGLNGRHNLENDAATSDEESQKACTTVVEVHDGITNKTRRYVFEGYKTKEEVLQVLKAKGYVKDIPHVVHADDDDEPHKPLNYATSLRTSESESEQSLLEIPLNRGPGAKVSSGPKYSTVSLDSTKCNKNRDRVKKTWDNSCAIVGAKADSKVRDRENQFLALHQRVSPLQPRPTKEKGFLLRFLTALICLCSKKSKQQGYSEIESGNGTDKA